MILESISLILRKTGVETFVPEVEVNVDGHSKIFLLDTGAASSSIANDSHVDTYPSIGETEAKAAAGIGKQADIIRADKISIGQHSFGRSQITRCAPSLLGLDFLKEVIFQIDLAAKKINFLNDFPTGNIKNQLRRLSTGHMTVPIKIETVSADTLFDTGADTTVVDSSFVKNNMDLFELIRSEDGVDAHGNKIPSEVYRCKSVQVGKIVVFDVEMAAFDFGENLRKHLEGAPLILGNNVIAKAKWTFDLKKNEWSCESVL